MKINSKIARVCKWHNMDKIKIANSIFKHFHSQSQEHAAQRSKAQEMQTRQSKKRPRDWTTECLFGHKVDFICDSNSVSNCSATLSNFETTPLTLTDFVLKIYSNNK
jgi:hypothetical protein